ncbi:MAG: BMP family ABC transporter substrate-binding protein [Acholeplasmataceae bacterium]|nr:BMP family ABC transporter substrate-binding protein [Acholeplasmataceae bacterium]
MKKTIIRLIILVLFVFITISTLGCGDEKEVINDGSTDGITKVCLIINGNLGDKSFFDSANEGIKMINNSHPEIVTTVKEIGQNTSNWESSLREVCESSEKYDLIIVGTDQMREKLQRIAPLYPGKKFIIFDADINKEAKGKTFNNVYSIKYMQNEGSFLAGVLAASWLQQLQPTQGVKKAGFVGGLKSDIIKDFAVGYYQGIQYINSLSGYIKTETYSSYVGGFTDSTTGKAQALSQYNNGAEIIFQAASQSGLGCIDAASELYKTKAIKKYIIGVDSDQYHYFSTGDTADLDKARRIVTSVLKRVDLSLFNAILEFQANTLEFGKVVEMGLNTIIDGQSVIGLAKNDYYLQIVPQEIRELIDEIELKIINGEITVDSTYDLTLAEFNAIEDDVKVK